MKRNLLLSSLFSIALGFSTIVGATYALFTNGDERRVEIQSGSVNVNASLSKPELYSPAFIDGNGIVTDPTNVATSTQFFNGGTVSIDDKTIKLTNMVKGDRASFKIYVENNSNVDIKYIAVLAAKEENSLFQELNVSLDGRTLYGIATTSEWLELKANKSIEPIDVVIELPSTAKDVYLDKEIEFTLLVKAVQANATVGNTIPLVYNNDQENRLDLEESIYAPGDHGSIKVEENTELKIYGNYNIESQENENKAYALWADGNDSYIFVKNGAYTQNVSGELDRYDLIHASNGGRIVIRGGTYKSATPEYTLTVDDNPSSQVLVKGGRFYKFDPSYVTLDSGEIVSFVDPGYRVYQDGDWYVVKHIPFFYSESEDAWMAGSFEAMHEFADEVNINKKKFKNETVKLYSHIDLEDENWVPIGLNKTDYFEGILDGKYNEVQYSISNLKVVRTLEEIKIDSSYAANNVNSGYGGLFGYTKAREIKNLTIRNVYIYAGHKVGAFTGDSNGTQRFENLRLEGKVEIYAWKAAGGITGTAADFMENIVIDVEKGSFINTAHISYDVLKIGNIEYLGGIFGHGWPNTIKDAYSNLDVVGGSICMGGISGGTAHNYINVHSSANVTMAYAEEIYMYTNNIKGENSYGPIFSYQTIGLISGWGSYNYITTYKNCTADGKIRIIFADGSPELDSNGMYFYNLQGEKCQDNRFGANRTMSNNSDNPYIIIDDSPSE